MQCLVKVKKIKKMDLVDATIEDLICMTEAVKSLNIKKIIYKEIHKRIYEKTFIIDDNDHVIRNRLTHILSDIYPKEELHFFNFVSKLITPKRKASSEKIEIVENTNETNETNEQVINQNGGGLDQEASNKKRKVDLNGDDSNKNEVDESIQAILSEIDFYNAKNSFKVCEICNEKDIIENEWAKHLTSFNHRKMVNSYLTKMNQVEMINRAFNSKVISYKILNSSKNILHCKEFLLTIKSIIELIINLYLQILKNLKINFRVHALYSKPPSDSFSTKCFNTKNFSYHKATNFNEFLNNLVENIQKQSEEFQESESGWSLSEILYLEINLHKNNSLKGSSYIPLSADIKNKGAIVNVKNNDQACFGWAVVSALYPPGKKHSQRTTSYPNYKDVLNLKDIEFPMKMKDVSIFEVNNNVSINIFGEEDGQIIGPYYHTSQRKSTHINLLFLENSDGNEHYCWIKNMSRLLSNQLSKHKGSKYICDGCLVYFQDKKLLERHQTQDCNKIRTFLPLPGSKLFFTHPERQMKVITIINYL